MLKISGQAVIAIGAGCSQSSRRAPRTGLRRSTRNRHQRYPAGSAARRWMSSRCSTRSASAVRLLRGYSGLVTRTSGDQIVLAALTSTDASGDAAVRAAFPHALQSEFTYSQAIRNRAPLNIADAYTDPRFPEAEHARSRARGYRSRVVVPMLGHDQAVGAIGVTRREPGGFTDDEIALLRPSPTRPSSPSRTCGCSLVATEEPGTHSSPREVTGPGAADRDERDSARDQQVAYGYQARARRRRRSAARLCEGYDAWIGLTEEASVSGPTRGRLQSPS